MNKNHKRVIKELKVLEKKDRLRGIRGHDAARLRNLQGRLIKHNWQSTEGDADDYYYSDVAD